jgi:uncharacterized protein GlcG (DUF336 family)
MIYASHAALSLADAQNIARAALEKAREHALRPITVAVLDAGGHLVCLLREDGASILRPEIARGKAYTALALGVSSRHVDEVAAVRPTFIASLANISPHGMIPAAGGILIGSDGDTIGAVGVSGDTPDNDEMCALHGVAALATKAADCSATA